MKPHIKYGLIGAGILAAWSLVGFVMGNEMQEKLKWVGYIVTFAVMIFCLRGAINDKKYFHNGFVSFKKAFGTAMLTSLIMWVVYSVFIFIYFKFINPELIPFMMDKAAEEMQNKGGMTDEQIEMGLKMQAKFMTPAIMSMFMFIWMMILSILLSLIMASILKKENPDGIFAEQTNQPS